MSARRKLLAGIFAALLAFAVGLSVAATGSSAHAAPMSPSSWYHASGPLMAPNSWYHA